MARSPECWPQTCSHRLHICSRPIPLLVVSSCSKSHRRMPRDHLSDGTKEKWTGFNFEITLDDTYLINYNFAILNFEGNISILVSQLNTVISYFALGIKFNSGHGHGDDFEWVLPLKLRGTVKSLSYRFKEFYLLLTLSLLRPELSVDGCTKSLVTESKEVSNDNASYENAHTWENQKGVA